MERQRKRNTKGPQKQQPISNGGYIDFRGLVEAVSIQIDASRLYEGDEDFTPEQKAWLKTAAEQTATEVQQVFNAITAKLDVISLNIELPDSNYYNADHLNLNGAKTFTKTLRAAISEQMIRQME